MKPLLFSVLTVTTVWLLRDTWRWYCDWARRELSTLLPRIRALRHSERHRFVVPVLVEIAGELSVDAICNRRDEDPILNIRIEFYWWARFVPGKKDSVYRKITEVLRDQHGIKVTVLR